MKQSPIPKRVYLPTHRVQRSRERCPDCGRMVAVTKVSAWEFAGDCPCGHAWIISYAHAAAPPAFEGEDLLLPFEPPLTDAPAD